MFVSCVLTSLSVVGPHKTRILYVDLYCTTSLSHYVCELCVDVIVGRGPPQDQNTVCRFVLYNLIESFMFVSCVLTSLSVVGPHKTRILYVDLYCTTSLSHLCL